MLRIACLQARALLTRLQRHAPAGTRALGNPIMDDDGDEEEIVMSVSSFKLISVAE